MIDTQYYQRRLEAELEAAGRADDPGIARIHRDMASRYRDLMNGDSGMPQPASQPTAETGIMFG